MAIKKSIDSYKPKAGDKFFVDTNIWIYILNIHYILESDKNEKRVEKYSNFLEKLVNSEVEIVLLSFSISELYNLYIKNTGKVFCSLKKIPNNKKNFKSIYRSDNQFIKDNNFIIDNIKNNILPLVKRINDEFDVLDIKKILIKKPDYDFNDNYYMQLCEKNNYKILTNDKDFSNSYRNVNVEVYTII